MLECKLLYVCLINIDMSHFIAFILFVIYVGGIWKFLSGFRHTNFNSSLPERITLALLWPVLLAANKSYRRNFRKALKGQ